MSANQKKMIAALEADLERVQCELDEAEQALTSERQRREEAEAALQDILHPLASIKRRADETDAVLSPMAHGIAYSVAFLQDFARNHFRKYEPGK